MGGCGSPCPAVPCATGSLRGASACKVSGSSCPRGAADQGRIKALGGEAAATRVERPSRGACCTQGCLGAQQCGGTVGAAPLGDEEVEGATKPQRNPDRAETPTMGVDGGQHPQGLILGGALHRGHPEPPRPAQGAWQEVSAGDTRGLAEKTQSRVRGLEGRRGGGQAPAHTHTHTCAHGPVPPLIPAPPRRRDCREPAGPGAPRCWRTCPTPVIYTPAIPTQTLIKRIIPGCAEPRGQRGRAERGGSEGGSSGRPPSLSLCFARPQARDRPNLSPEA